MAKVNPTARELVKHKEELQANAIKLQGCPKPHDFSIKHIRGGGSGVDIECTRCHGVVSMMSSIWYDIGLADGRT